MGLECVITVPGDGKGQYGRFKSDRTGQVSQFTVCNSFLYSQVFRHVKECDRCSPDDVLRTLLDRKMGKDGMVAQSMAELAMRYWDKLPRRTDVNLVKRILSRECGKVLAEHCSMFSTSEIPMILRDLQEVQRIQAELARSAPSAASGVLFGALRSRPGVRAGELAGAVWAFFVDPGRPGRLPDDDQEILDVAMVAGVMAG